jgi:hypothetical protein
VESLIEADEAITRDMDMKTSLIESRWVCGSKRVARALEKRITRMRRNDREEFLRRKITDALGRYEKFGRSYQLIEPDVKFSPGGMRDYQTLVWLGSVGRLPHGLLALKKKGLLLPGERRELEEAYDFLLRVRAEMHIATRETGHAHGGHTAGRGEGTGLPRCNNLAVEFFMRSTTATRTIYRITPRLHRGARWRQTGGRADGAEQDRDRQPPAEGSACARRSCANGRSTSSKREG